MDGVRSIERIAEVLRVLDADVVCLQEVNRRLPWSRFEDQPARLSKLLGMRAAFQSNYRVGVGGFGNAILTKLAVRSHIDVKLPNPRERVSILRRMEGRGLLGLTINSNGLDVLVLCTHWSLDSGDRRESIPVVERVLSDWPGPALLAGDLNALDDSPEVRALISTSKLTDCGGATRSQTFTSSDPTSRIDYVFHTPHLEAGVPEVIQTLASDHLPVCVDFQIVAG